MREQLAAAAAEILICGINYACVFPTNHESMKLCGTLKKLEKKGEKCKVRVRPLSGVLAVLCTKKNLHGNC